jgi:ATP-dependent exoDNAse (exonuclease V) beta subunit
VSVVPQSLALPRHEFRRQWPRDLLAILDGPGRAVASASAGTGKTTFLVEKIARVAGGERPEREDPGRVRADRIVCITYTNKAAGELRDRAYREFRLRLSAARSADEAAVLRERLRLLQAAPICTLHALAGRLLRRYPVEAGVDADFPVIENQIEAAALRRQAADAVLRKAAVDPADGEWNARLIARYRLDDRGRAGGLASLLAGAVVDYANAGSDPRLLSDAAVDDNWPPDADGAGETSRAGRTLTKMLADTLAEYDCLKAGRLDFHDLLTRARDLLRDHPAVRRDCRRRFALVLLDEAQDTSPLQMDIVERLTSDSDDAAAASAPGDRLIVVGDPKQAIYRFQGADTQQFLRVSDRLSAGGGRRVFLQENRRCAPGIIAFVNQLAPGLFDPDSIAGRAAVEEKPKPKAGGRGGRKAAAAEPEPADAGTAEPKRPAKVLEYDDRQALIPKRPAREAPAVWHLTRGDWTADEDGNADTRRREEAAGIARLIGHLTDPANADARVYDPGDDRTGRPARFGDVAILLAAKTGLAIYLSALREAGIPFHSEAGEGFFEDPGVRDGIALLRTLVNPTDRAASAALLRSPAFALTDAAWLGLCTGDFFGARLDRLSAPPREPGEKREGEAPAGPSPAEPADDDFVPPERPALPPHVETLLARWRELRTLRDRLSPAELLERWWEATHARALAAQGEDPRTALANLDKLAAVVRDHFDQGRTLREIVDTLAAADEADEPDAPAVGPRDDVVRVMTIHKSKGLEFPVVILADSAAVPRRNETAALKFVAGKGLVGKSYDEVKDELTDTDAYAKWKNADEVARGHDARKLLYVALTRARDLLVLSGDRLLRKDGEPWKGESFRSFIDAVPGLWEQVHPVRIDSLRPRRTDRTSAWGAAATEPDPALAEPPPWPGAVAASELASAAEAVARAGRAVEPGQPRRREAGATDLMTAYARRLRAAGKLPRRTARDPAGADPHDAAEVGTLVHQLLEGVRFDSPPDEAELRRRAANLGADVTRPAFAAAVRGLARHLPGVLSRRLAGVPSSDTFRETPLTLRIERNGKTAVVTGIADLLWHLGGAAHGTGRWGLLDFKTVAASRQPVYEFQVRLYAAALRRCGRPVSAAWVLFLGEDDPASPEHPVPLDGDPAAFESEVFDLVWRADGRP